jgi:hypothetical protein
MRKMMICHWIVGEIVWEDIIYARGGYNFFDGIGWAGADWAGVGWGVMVRTCTLTVTSAHMWCYAEDVLRHYMGWGEVSMDRPGLSADMYACNVMQCKVNLM